MRGTAQDGEWRRMGKYPDHNGFVAVALAGTGTPRRFARNKNGRDFVVGDLHGAFATLEALLDKVSFDTRRDRLFSVGDLVDRGAASGKALDWIEARPWFHAVRGNHEQLLLDSAADYRAMQLWMSNGGDWWHTEDDNRQTRFRNAVARLPFALRIKTATGRVGVIHADIPSGWNWDSMCARLEAGDREAICHALWLRERCRTPKSSGPVAGNIDRIYCGHTPMKKPTTVSNVHYLDTGAGWGDRLTIAEIHPRRHRTHTLAVID